MKKILLVLMVSLPILGQDFMLTIPGIDHDYSIPVDTTFRRVALNNYDLGGMDPPEILTLDIIFPASNIDIQEYRFVSFLRGEYFYSDEYSDDTLDFELTPFSSIDSVWVEEMEIHGESILGIRYLNLPGDNISGFTVAFTADSSMVHAEHLSFWVSADTLSNWLDFQPMALGNIWKYTGPAPIYMGHRHEVIDTYSSEDSTFFRIARQRQYEVEYDQGISQDTVVVYTLSGQYHTLFSASGSYEEPSVNLLPIEELNPQVYEGVVPQADGSVYFGQWGLGNSVFWKYGVGHSSNFGDGFGQITRLIGSRIDGVTHGDISVMVGIDEPSKRPDTFQLDVFPNPFNATLNIHYTLPESVAAGISIFNMNGQLVWEQLLEQKSQGSHKLRWSPGNEIASGVYFIQIKGAGLKQIQKVLLLK